ncbi:MAG: DeoR/GlpR transcriptional regulator, partial [Chloroflexi bacterium]|nr:DeoR/GlpR transcriptional regulator [Chloroflexota bacterium]
MSSNERLENITLLVDERGFLTVRDLSEHFNVSEMTIRRDLQLLDELGKLQRTYGGAASINRVASQLRDSPEETRPETMDELLANRVDVII